MLRTAPVTRAYDTLRRLCDALCRVQTPIRIIRSLAWDRSVHEQFLLKRGRELPRPTYPPLGFDPAAKIREVRDLRRRIRGANGAEELLRGVCDQTIATIRLLSSRGTKNFYRYSVELFGHPRDEFAEASDEELQNLEIARYWASRPRARKERPTLTAAECASRIRSIVRPIFGDSCEVKISHGLAAYAAAGPRSIAVRADARFTPRQARALAHHEGLWHVLTARNGTAQPILTVLSSGLRGHTESQEGGGIVSEYLTGNVTNDRFIELAERTLAIDRAARGADYVDVWRDLASRWGEEKACHLAERVFRGGVLTGGAPFTKDAVYQRGYCRVYNFLRAALDRRDEDLVLAFFAGKMSVDDAPTVRALMHEGIVARPKFLPEWWRKRDRLFAQVTHSVTLNRFSMMGVKEFYAERHRTAASR
ncbi:MAG: flavohemoglobin expression-modulating QEGLA motif protein [Myxococcales bacterium]